MRILLTIVIFLTAAAVDELWFDGRYRHALWQEANVQLVCNARTEFIRPMARNSSLKQIAL